MTNSGLAADAVAWENPADITEKIVLPDTSKATLSNGERKTGASSGNQRMKENRKSNQNDEKKEQRTITTEDLFKL